MNNTLGIIFSNIHDRNVPELTQERTMASVPFGGKYRLIDFALSNMVNAGVIRVGVITKKNYQSLMDHVGSGKDWDLARKKGGLIILPPYSEAESNGLYTNRLQALKGIMPFISDSDEEYVILADSDNVCNIPLKDVIEKHESNNADVTAVYRNMQGSGYTKKNDTVLTVNDKGRVTDIAVYDGADGNFNIGINVWVMKKSLLINFVKDAIAHGKTSFTRDVISPRLSSLNVMGYNYDGYYSCIDSLNNYLKESLRLLDRKAREELFCVEGRPIYTKIKDSVPTHYGNKSNVQNSIVADGCVIEGTVKNCILHRGVFIGRGAVLQDSVIMQNGYIGQNSVLNCAIVDRNVVVKDNKKLSGDLSAPFYISKGKII